MTKKQKDETLPQLEDHQRKIYHVNQQGSNLLTLVSLSQHKKGIKKPEQQIKLAQRVELLKEKNSRVFKNAEKKIDRIIDIIDEINEKSLEAAIKKTLPQLGKSHQIDGNRKQQTDEQKNHQLLIDSSTIWDQQVVNKALSQLHNILTYEKPLSFIKHQFQSFYNKLSAFAKELDSEKSLPDDKKFLIPQNGLSFEETRLLLQLIKEHYLRVGLFDVANMFDNYGEQQNYIHKDQELHMRSLGYVDQKNNHKNKLENQPLSDSKLLNPKKPLIPKKRLKVELLNQEQNFKQCFILREQILDRKFEEAINWCAQQRLYQTHSNPLEFELRLTEVKILISERKYDAAFNKISQEMEKFLDNYEEEINLLIGFLLFSCDWNSRELLGQSDLCDISQALSAKQRQLFTKITSERYCQFNLNRLSIEQMAQKFTHQYFIHYGISQFDTLEICYKVGKQYEQKYFEAIQMFSQKDKQEFLNHKIKCEGDNRQGTHSIILPFEISVDKEHLYHSIFVCPVTKEVLSSNDGVEFLSCGHLVSQSAKKSMAEVRRSNHKQKCPVCQKDRTSQVIKVSF